jgi:serine protease Do
MPRNSQTLVAVFCLGAISSCRPRAAARDAGVDAGAESPSVSRPARIQYPAGHGSFVDVVGDASSAVVAIRATTPVKSGPAAIFPGAPEAVSDVAIGTGFLIEHKGTYVLTNDHIAAAAPELRVVLADGSEAVASIVGRDPRLDLALLSVSAPRLPTLPLGHSSELQVGEWVVALGNPFGHEVTASAGIVSATGRHALGSYAAGPSSLYRTYLQTDARIHRGNTGGPLLNTAGEVVGVLVAVDDRPGEVSFAIPIDRVREVLDALRDFGAVARAYAGFRVNVVPEDIAAQLPEKGGAIVTEVEPGSPAIRAGIRPGDVVLKWDGKAVDHRSLPSLVPASTVGKKINVTVWRSGGLREIALVPEKQPS